MAMEIVPLRQQQADTGGMVVADRHWYLTEDKSRVVEESDPAGRWLWAAPGDEVPRADAARLGAITPPEPAPSAETEPEPKQRRPAANKQRTRSEDKGS